MVYAMNPKKDYHHGDLKNALIQAGIAILAEEGFNGLSLRKAARRAGVSHSAPYAHFADKQALVAAISTEGFYHLYTQLLSVSASWTNDPPRLLVENAWSYIQFALADPARFKIMFSGILEKEQSFPDFTEISSLCYQLLVNTAHTCQASGLFKTSSPELMAVTVWSLTHGFICLVLERQIPGQSLQPEPLKTMLVELLSQLTLWPLNPADYPLLQPGLNQASEP